MNDDRCTARGPAKRKSTPSRVLTGPAPNSLTIQKRTSMVPSVEHHECSEGISYVLRVLSA
eukprot:6199157-Pleurochrysis_carterae.AAC.1